VTQLVDRRASLGERLALDRHVVLLSLSIPEACLSDLDAASVKALVCTLVWVVRAARWLRRRANI